MSELHSISAPRADGLQAETEAALLRTYITGYGGPTGSIETFLRRVRLGLEDES